MLSFFYNCLLFFLALITLPKFLWQWLVVGKYRQSAKERFGLGLPSLSPSKEQKVIWIHTISLGETKAVAPLFALLRKSFLDAVIVISSITETGHAEAKRSMPGANAHFFLPLDFSWLIKKVVKKFHPDVLVMVESDFWYHLLLEAKKNEAYVLLVNGKISERSAKRFSSLSYFARKIFSLFDRLCLQNEVYKQRFLSIGVSEQKMAVTGNIKLDATYLELSFDDKKALREELGLSAQDKVLVIGSTHAPEELEILFALDKVWKKYPHLKVLIVPRHPERFKEVEDQIKARSLSLITYTQRHLKTGQERVILIDAMGLLTKCYQLADLAIVGGSFTDRVGGHNVFEPVQVGTPVLFGPHMFSQKELVDVVLSGEAGRQVTLSELPQTILTLFKHPEDLIEMKKKCLLLSGQVKGSLERTWQEILPFFKKKGF